MRITEPNPNLTNLLMGQHQRDSGEHAWLNTMNKASHLGLVLTIPRFFCFYFIPYSWNFLFLNRCNLFNKKKRSQITMKKNIACTFLCQQIHFLAKKSRIHLWLMQTPYIIQNMNILWSFQYLVCSILRQSKQRVTIHTCLHTGF